MPGIVIPKSFKKRLDAKPPRLAGAIIECVSRLGENPRYPGLRVHPIQGRRGVFEARVDRANRVTFHYGADGAIVLRSHCSHDIIERSP